ncbi:MAG: transcription elongation factor Spt5 [Thermoprotei archaeon]|nr:MAG: transcription elongation factor Spt5 [Thermoprotei archaeon]HDJ97221.1 transcription elongation factor Spt5 [Thermofilum sp.]HFC49286.1 transcription elongation factor Spt5 [Thermofilum sp.]
MSEDLESRPLFYAVRTTVGQEYNVASTLDIRARRYNLPVRSILVIPALKGLVIVETIGIQVVTRLVIGVRHAKGVVRGAMSFKDLEKFVVPKPMIEVVSIGDIVEITYGPLMGMKGKIVHIDKAKGEVKVEVAESAYPLPITINAEYIKILSKGEESETVS